MKVPRIPKTPTSEFDAFSKLVDCVLAVPHDELVRREKEYRKQVEANPKKRGPKRKARLFVRLRESEQSMSRISRQKH